MKRPLPANVTRSRKLEKICMKVLYKRWSLPVFPTLSLHSIYFPRNITIVYYALFNIRRISLFFMVSRGASPIPRVETWKEKINVIQFYPRETKVLRKLMRHCIGTSLTRRPISRLCETWISFPFLFSSFWQKPFSRRQGTALNSVLDLPGL